MTFLGYEWYNDIDRLPYYLVWLAIYFAVLILSIFLHELGHWIVIKRYGKNPKFKFRFDSIWSFGGEMTGFDDITDEQYRVVLTVGVLTGLIPIIISSFFFFPIFLLIVPYGFICFKDLKEISENTNWEE